MKWIAAIALVLLLGLFADAPAVAQPQQDGAASQAEPLRSETRRPRTRLRVYPRYPYRHYHSLYPTPYPVEYPGPNARRDCAVRYVPEHRLSGTVIVPRMNCRWVRG